MLHIYLWTFFFWCWSSLLLTTTTTITAAAAAAEGGEEEYVRTLGSSDFNEVITSNTRVLVEFYAPWCGHCKALQPEYEKAAKRLHDEGSETILAKVDATEYPDLASKYSIDGYPTLKYFVEGNLENPQEYTGGRTEETIVSWIVKRELPAVTILPSESDVETFKNKYQVALVAYLKGDKENNPAIAALYQTAEALREEIVVALVQSDSGVVKLYRKFDEPEATMKGELTVEGLKTFIETERFPLFDQISTDNYREYMLRGLPMVWVALEGSDTEQLATITEALKDVTKTFKGKLSIVWIDNAKYGQHVSNLGIKDIPGLILIAETGKYLFDGDITNSKTVKEWFSKYESGKLEKYLKSQEPPQNNDEPVFVLVGKTFEEVVGKDKDVFVEFYAPWCGHCKRLTPEYEKVGIAFKGVKNMVIANIDATENDTPEDIHGFPTLIFYPKGSNKGTKYEGGRTAAEMIQWLEDHATVDVAGIEKEEL